VLSCCMHSCNINGSTAMAMMEEVLLLLFFLCRRLRGEHDGFVRFVSPCTCPPRMQSTVRHETFCLPVSVAQSACKEPKTWEILVLIVLQ